MKRVLALDPGITTGYAVLSFDGEILDVGELQPNEVKALKSYVGNSNLEVVIEFTPVPTMSKMNLKLRDVVAKLRLMFPQHHEIKPGQWKQTPVYRHNVPNEWHGKLLSYHMRDAVRIAVYYLTFIRSSG